MVEHATENRGVSSSILLLGTTAEVAEQADAAVSKTVGGQLPCRFEPGLRH